MALIKQPISNHNLFSDVQRFVEIQRFTVSDIDKTIVIRAIISYMKNGIDVSASFQQEVPSWVIGNHYRIIARDENLQPIPNPEYKEIKEDGIIVNESEKFLQIPAYDYFKDVVFEKGLPLKQAFQSYIVLDDQKGRFNFNKIQENEENN